MSQKRVYAKGHNESHLQRTGGPLRGVVSCCNEGSSPLDNPGWQVNLIVIRILLEYV